MKYAKYCCAILAVLCFIVAVLPDSFDADKSAAAAAIIPAWAQRIIAILDFFILSAIFYGLQKRHRIFWTLIPILIIAYFLTMIIPALLIRDVLSTPFLPFTFMAFIFLIFATIFFIHWKNYRSYFNN